MTLLRIALKESRTGPYTQADTSAFFGAASKLITHNAYFWLLPHVFHCYSTGFPLIVGRASRLLSPAATRPNPGLELPNAQQLRQLGDIRRDPPRLNGQNRRGRDTDG